MPFGSLQFGVLLSFGVFVVWCVVMLFGWLLKNGMLLCGGGSAEHWQGSVDLLLCVTDKDRGLGKEPA